MSRRLAAILWLVIATATIGSALVAVFSPPFASAQCGNGGGNRSTAGSC